ncbi:MAG: hypothetical protein U9Q81_18095, partial [Pseudomonadota bacterium]|nr:hypothetical protein [Pseudomonadota bacterium]
AKAEKSLAGPAGSPARGCFGGFLLVIGFSAFAELEFERLRNSEDDFDPEVFREAVELVLGKIEGNPGESGDDHQ